MNIQRRTGALNTVEKKAALLELARKRQADDLSAFKGSYCHLRDLDCECDHVVPWTISAFNVDAELMLIAQDWASEDFLLNLDEEDRLEQKALGQIPWLETNKKLERRVLPQFGLAFADTYATDVFAFVKRGSMTARISFVDLVLSARRYTLPQIEIVRPQMVICLGSASFNAVRRAVLEQQNLGVGTPDRRWMRLSDSWKVLNPHHTSFLDVPIFGVAHPGGTGTRASGGEKVTAPRLAALASFFATIRRPPADIT